MKSELKWVFGSCWSTLSASLCIIQPSLSGWLCLHHSSNSSEKSVWQAKCRENQRLCVRWLQVSAKFLLGCSWFWIFGKLEVASDSSSQYTPKEINSVVPAQARCCVCGEWIVLLKDADLLQFLRLLNKMWPPLSSHHHSFHFTMKWHKTVILFDYQEGRTSSAQKIQ